MIKKNLKPIDFDVYIRYICPNSNCRWQHWLSLKETQTKNFKVVCGCGQIFQPKRIKKIKCVFSATKSKGKNPEAIKNPKELTSTIDKTILDKSINALMSYGFTKSESEEMLNKAYKIKPTKNSIELIKLALENIGVSE